MLYLAIAMVLPFVTGQIPEIGAMLCPMHIPALLCGFLCGWPWGLVVGFIAPLLRGAVFGMPVLFPTGVAMEIPQGYVGLVYARSGIACKRGLAPANKVGVIDSDYRGEILVALHNDGSLPRSIEPGERIAQLVIVPCLAAAFAEANELSDTERGAGGFGSTGRK